MTKAALIIPTLNEAAYIGPLLETLIPQRPDTVIEIIVADGGSMDGTQGIVSDYAARDSRIKLIENTKRRQSAGVNRAAELADPAADILIRIDAHAGYPADFVAILLAEQEESGADSVVSHLWSVGFTCFQKAVAAASNSAFGTGGAAHRMGGSSRFVDHGHHALFMREAFSRIGGYDEGFITNEDAELDTRLRAAGGRIWFSGRSVVSYYPRATPGKLLRQYFLYGQGRARTRAKHEDPLRARQLLPPLLAISILLSILFAPFAPILLIVPALYAAGVLVATAHLILKTRDTCAAGAAIALPAMHIGWGCGFILESIAGLTR